MYTEEKLTRTVPDGLITGRTEINAPRAVGQGRLLRLVTGGYVTPELWETSTRRGQFLLTAAAVARRDPDTVFCGESAIALYGLPVLQAPPTVDVVATAHSRLGRQPDRFRPPAGVEVGRRPPLVRRHEHHGIEPVALGEFLVVPLHVAVAEVFSTARLWRSLPIADALVKRSGRPLETWPELMETIERIPVRAKRDRCRRVMSLALAGAANPGESAWRARLLIVGLPQPVLQVRYTDSQGVIGETDGTWDRFRVIGEFDGYHKYGVIPRADGLIETEALVREKRREDRLRALGFQVSRWMWDDLWSRDRLLAPLAYTPLRPDPDLMVPPF